MRHYKFQQTCPGCPEQYDVWDNSKNLIAYVRYRWGYLRVNPYKENGDIDFDTIIYDESIGDNLDGTLPNSNRQKILNKIDEAIYHYYNDTNNNEI